MLTQDFLIAFRERTELIWSSRSLSPEIYGFQFQRGTRWNKGLSVDEIPDYERSLGFTFPCDLKAFLREMNGTDLEMVNLYGNSGEPRRSAVGVYAYPRDLFIVRRQIETVNRNRAAMVADLSGQGFRLAGNANLFPIYSHRFVVCVPESESTVVLSAVTSDVDAIVYADSLKTYLQREFLSK